MEQAVDQQVVAFIKRYRPAIIWCINSFAIPPSDRKDVYQDVCLRILMRFRRHGAPGAGPGVENSGYAVAITRHVCLDHYRRQGRRPRSAGGDAVLPLLAHPDAMGADEALDRSQAHDRLHLAVATLPPMARAIMHRVLLGYTNKEIAGHFDISEAATKVITHRARKLLRQRLLRP